MELKSKDQYLNYIHYFRGLSIILIVGVHCRTSIPWPKDSFMHEVLFYGLDFASILFVFISGFLFQYLHADKLDYGPYLLKKVKHVVVPYLIVSIPALADKLFIETQAHWMTEFYYSLNPIFKILYMLVTGKHSGPFYFIPVIFAIFLLAPLFYFLQRLKHFNLIAFVIVFIGMFSYNYAYYATYTESLVYFIPVYTFGIWACKNRHSILNMNNFWFSLLVLCYLTINVLELTHIIYVDRMKNFGTVQYFSLPFNWAKFKVMCEAIILMCFFFRFREHQWPFLKTLGNYSFGIYFIHIYFINITVFLLKHFNISLEQNIALYLCYLAMVMGASMLTVYLVKVIFKKNSRLVIGS